MSKIEKQLMKAAMQGLGLIGELARTHAGDTKAGKVLGVIGSVVDTLGEGFDRKISPEEVVAKIEESMAELEKSLATNDAAADALIDAKFGKAGSAPAEAPAETAPPADADPVA